VLDGERFYVSVYNHEHVNLHPHNDGQIGGTDNVDEAITKWRETLAELKRQIDANTPKTCESCNVALAADLTCPQCGVSHTAPKCRTCGRFGLHADDCTEPPGHDTEGGPAYVSPEDRSRELRGIANVLENAYQYYMGWGFEFEHHGAFCYYQLGGDLRVYFTPDFNGPGTVEVQVCDHTGESLLGDDSDNFDFKADRIAPVLFKIVKPYLDRLIGKSAADLTKELKK
jgi:predicted RNA-binding Zn-ribbon protein involved in translation (DUF1610 family)